MHVALPRMDFTPMARHATTQLKVTLWPRPGTARNRSEVVRSPRYRPRARSTAVSWNKNVDGLESIRDLLTNLGRQES
jgi:hypothetical protein